MTMVWPSSSTARREEAEDLGARRGSRGCRWARRRRRSRAGWPGPGPRPPAAAGRRRARTGGGAGGRAARRWRSPGRARPRRACAPARRRRERDVLEGGEGGHQVEGLEHEADLVAAQQGERRLSESAPRSVSPTSTWPEVSVSSPATQCISVDLPEPEGPMIAVKRPAGEVDGHVVEGPHGGVAAAVDLGGADGPGGDRTGLGGGHRAGCGSRGGVLDLHRCVHGRPLDQWVANHLIVRSSRRSAIGRGCRRASSGRMTSPPRGHPQGPPTSSVQLSYRAGDFTSHRAKPGEGTELAPGLGRGPSAPPKAGVLSSSSKSERQRAVLRRGLHQAGLVGEDDELGAVAGVQLHHAPG